MRTVKIKIRLDRLSLSEITLSGDANSFHNRINEQSLRRTAAQGLQRINENSEFPERAHAFSMLKEKLKQALSFEVEEISDKLKGGNPKIHKLEEVQKTNMSAISHVFGTLMPTLVVIGENPKRREIITEMAKLIFDEHVNVYQVNLPNHAYGTKPKSVKQKEHLKAQVEIWFDTIHQIKKACSMPIFALVEAPIWFPSSNGKQQKDDPLNKVNAIDLSIYTFILLFSPHGYYDFFLFICFEL